jgi:hypothetical protein
VVTNESVVGSVDAGKALRAQAERIAVERASGVQAGWGA